MRFRNLVLAAAIISSCAQVQADGGIGYPNVSDALKALKARKDVTFTSQSGWSIADDRATQTVWAFTPAYHLAYPAVVKRTVLAKGGASGMQTKSLCRASKAVCDQLIDEFNALNVKSSQDLPLAGAMPTPLPPSVVDVELLPGDAYQLTLKSYRSGTWETGQQELLPKAKQVCGQSEPNFGKYQYETMEAVTGPTAGQRQLVLRQQVTCGSVMADVEVQQPAPVVDDGTPWKPSAEQIKRVENATRLYLSLKDGGKYASAFAMLSPGLQAATPLEVWKFNAEAFQKKSGVSLQRKIKKIGWLHNPPKAAPGNYAAVDFSSRFANINIHCGFLAWQEQADGSFKIVREEQNYIDKPTEHRVTPENLQKMRERFGCT